MARASCRLYGGRSHGFKGYCRDKTKHCINSQHKFLGALSMLVHLSVHNYAIVEHLDLELERGMSVITGETGAGKSIMLDALGLALGDRGDSGVVRPGADKADILATFDLGDIPEART